jgi:hypothetical protein
MDGPTPYKYVSEMNVGRSLGISTPNKRGIVYKLLLSNELALPLFVAGVAAHDVHHAAAADNLAILANTLDAGTDFHGRLDSWAKANEYKRFVPEPSSPGAARIRAAATKRVAGERG